MRHEYLVIALTAVSLGWHGCKARNFGTLASRENQIPPAAISVMYPSPATIPSLEKTLGWGFKDTYENMAMTIQRELAPRFCAGLWPRLVASGHTAVNDKRFQAEPPLPEAARRIFGQNCNKPDFGLIAIQDFERIMDLADGKLEPDGRVPPLFRFSFATEENQLVDPGKNPLDSLDMAAPWRWHVVSFRYMPCAQELQSQSRCLPELRVVAQPLLAYGPIEMALAAGLPDSASETRWSALSTTGSDRLIPAFADYAVHLFYRLTPQENQAVRDAILGGIRISKAKGCEPPLTALRPHQCLTLESKSNSDFAFAEQMQHLLGIVKSPFYRTAVMVSRQNNTAWKFYPLKRNKSGELVRDLIPALDPESAAELGPKAAVSQRMEQVFSRGLAPDWKGYGATHVRANPRPKRTVDSLDLFIRTNRGFQTDRDYKIFMQSQRDGLERYMRLRGLNLDLTDREINDIIRSGNQTLRSPSVGQTQVLNQLPKGFLATSDFKMAIFWAAIEKQELSTVKKNLALDPQKDESLTKGCMDASCALQRITAARLTSLPTENQQSKSQVDIQEARKWLVLNGLAFTADIRGLANTPAETLESRAKSLSAVTARIDDPSINSEFTVDCVSCHVSHFENYSPDDDPLQTIGIFKDDMDSNGMYMTNQFSYYRDVPIVSRRVQNETIDQLKSF